MLPDATKYQHEHDSDRHRFATTHLVKQNRLFKNGNKNSLPASINLIRMGDGYTYPGIDTRRIAAFTLD